MRHQYQFQCRGSIKVTLRGAEIVTYFLLAGDRQLPPMSPGTRDHRRPVMTSSILPCVVQSCTSASPRGLFRSSSSRDGQGQTPPVLGRVSMTPPSSLGRHRKQQQQAPSVEPWLNADQPLRRLAAPPSSLTVPVAGEWLEHGGRSPDLPVVHYCNANIAQGSAGGGVDGCIHIRGMSESSTPTSPPGQQQRRRLSSSGDVSTVVTSPTVSPTVAQPGRSPALRDGVGQGRVLQRIGESPNESGLSRRAPPVDDVDGQYDIDAIMKELALDVERIVASTPSSSRLVDQSVQTSNLVPALPAACHHHHHPVITRAADHTQVHLPPSRATHHAAAAMQPPLGAVKLTSVREPSRPLNLIKMNGAVSNNFVANNSGLSYAAVDRGVAAALTSRQIDNKVSPPPLPPPHDIQQRDGHLFQRGHGASAFKPVSSDANNRSLGVQLLNNNVDQSPFRAHPLQSAGPVPVICQLRVQPQPPVRRRAADSSRPTAALVGPAPSFRVRRSACVTSLPRLCRSLENIASDVDDSAPRSGSSSRADSPAAPAARQRRPGRTDNHHQLLLLHPDDVSLSSFDGTASELSRSDPALSSYGDTSEYDNYRPGMASDEDYFVPEPISDVDIDLFDDVDVDNVQVSDTYAALDTVAIPPFNRRIVDDV